MHLRQVRMAERFMQNRKTLSLAILVSVSFFCLILVLSMFRHLKRMESDFRDKKAALVKENMDLKDEFGFLQEELVQKAEALTFLAEENEKLKEEYTTRIESMKSENAALGQKIKDLEEKPLAEQLRDALYSEKNEKLKKFLEKVLYNIMLIQSGKSIALEPIVVAEREEGVPAETAGAKLEREPAEAPKRMLLPAGKKGKVLSVDKKHNLIVVDLGKRDDVVEGAECVILKGEKEIASAEIISVRYNVSAAFVNDWRYNYHIRNIKEGEAVFIVE